MYRITQINSQHEKDFKAVFKSLREAFEVYDRYRLSQMPLDFTKLLKLKDALDQKNNDFKDIARKYYGREIDNSGFEN